MLALAASAFLVLYILLPASFARWGTSSLLPLRSVRRTSTEEAIVSLLLVSVPFALATTVVHHLPGAKNWPWPVTETAYLQGNTYNTLREDDYRAILSVLSNDNSLKPPGVDIWESFKRAERRQQRFLFWYYILAVAFGCCQGLLGRVYERTREREDQDQTPATSSHRTIWKALWKWVAEKLILRNVSKWPALLKPSSLGLKNTVVKVQILTSDGNLYRGTVSGHYVDADDELSGLILVKPQRRKLTPAESSDLKTDQASTFSEPALPTGSRDVLAIRSDWKPKGGWRDIPGAKLYFAADKIINLNLSHTSPPTEELIVRFVKETLQPGMPTFRVSVQGLRSESTGE